MVLSALHLFKNNEQWHTVCTVHSCMGCWVWLTHLVSRLDIVKETKPGLCWMLFVFCALSVICLMHPLIVLNSLSSRYMLYLYSVWVLEPVQLIASLKWSGMNRSTHCSVYVCVSWWCAVWMYGSGVLPDPVCQWDNQTTAHHGHCWQPVASRRRHSTYYQPRTCQG